MTTNLSGTILSNLFASRALYQPFAWIHVTKRFNNFIKDISLTDVQVNDAITKIRGVVKCLNQNYWQKSSEDTNYMLVGSWGKKTTVRPPRDIDILFSLPHSVYGRFESRSGNKQSQLLQEVKQVLATTYSNTDLRGDRQVVVVPFNSFKVEVVPAFLLNNGQVLICDTKQGGIYKNSDPNVEKSLFDNASDQSNGNVRDLVRMLKCWQSNCKVPLKSFQLELLSIEFINSWAHRGRNVFWYDWMVRDFFAFLQMKTNHFIVIPGTLESISLGHEWLSKAKIAYNAALAACQHEYNNEDYLACLHWQKIFGNDINT